MRSNDIDSTQHPAEPRLRLIGNDQQPGEDRGAFYCIALHELEPSPGVTILIHPALISRARPTPIPEVPRV